MEDCSKASHSYSVLGIPKSASLSDICNGDNNEPKTPRKKKFSNHKRNKGGEELHISSPKLLSRTTSRISPMRSPTFSRGASRRSMTPPPQVDLFRSFPGTASNGSTPTSATQHDPTFLSKAPSRRSTTPIFFSQSADIIFIIDEKRHPIFKREGDDLELGVEVPLAQALTGCTVPVPLLGGGNINLSIEDIIYPGYEMRIPEQGMPKSKQEGSRGDLRLKFMVEFPSELSEEQRSEVVRILEECS